MTKKLLNQIKTKMHALQMDLKSLVHILHMGANPSDVANFTAVVI